MSSHASNAEFDGLTEPDPSEMALTDTPDPANSRFGVVLFDGGMVGSGWACRDGQEPFRIAGPTDLDSATLWLTDVDYDEARESGLASNPWCLRGDWARVKLKDMRDEWGMADGSPGADPANATTLLASCFARMMRFSYEAHGLDPRRAPFPSGFSLATWLAPLHPEPEMPPRHLGEACQHSLQEFTRTGARDVDGGRTVVLRPPRLTYGRAMLAAPVPRGPWDQIEAKDMPAPSKRAAWLADMADKRPVLAKIVVLRATDSMADILAFGYGARVPREWVSGPELKVLSRVADLQIDMAWVGAESAPGATKLSNEGNSRLLNPLSALSWSYGLYVENLWLAGTRPAQSSGRRPGQKGPQPPAKIPSFRGVWLRACDRIALFGQAVRLNNLGYRVVGYGAGALRLSVADEMVGDLLNDAFSIGLLPSLAVTAAPDLARYLNSATRYPDPKRWGGDKAGLAEALLRLRGDRELVSTLDGVPELPADEARAAIARVLTRDAAQRS